MAVQSTNGAESTGLAGPIGPTRLGEYLMVDVRVVQLVGEGSRLWSICRELSRRHACGVVEATLVIDLLETSVSDREYLLDFSKWPTTKPLPRPTQPKALELAP